MLCYDLSKDTLPTTSLIWAFLLILGPLPTISLSWLANGTSDNISSKDAHLGVKNSGNFLPCRYSKYKLRLPISLYISSHNTSSHQVTPYSLWSPHILNSDSLHFPEYTTLWNEALKRNSSSLIGLWPQASEVQPWVTETSSYSTP